MSGSFLNRWLWLFSYITQILAELLRKNRGKSQWENELDSLKQTPTQHSFSQDYCLAILSPREFIQTSKRSYFCPFFRNVWGMTLEFMVFGRGVLKTPLLWEKSSVNQLFRVSDDITQSAGLWGDSGRKSYNPTAYKPQTSLYWHKKYIKTKVILLCFSQKSNFNKIW